MASAGHASSDLARDQQSFKNHTNEVTDLLHKWKYTLTFFDSKNNAKKVICSEPIITGHLIHVSLLISHYHFIYFKYTSLPLLLLFLYYSLTCHYFYFVIEK